MSQKNIVLKQLRENGEVTRNWCLERYITRLGAIMCQLRKEGVNYEAKSRGGDYVYKLLDKPQIKEYFVGGIKVAQKVIW